MILRSKKDLWTIPNILTYVRFLLIPLLVWLYVVKDQYLLAAIVFTVSGLTDVADGFIARHFNLTTDWGKIIDPVADKLTQFTLICCIATRYKDMRYLIILLVVKELYMAIMGLVILKKTEVINSAKWYGKLCTVVLYLVVMMLTMYVNIPLIWADVLILIGFVFMCISIAGYTKQYVTRLIKIRKKNKEKVEKTA